MSRCWIVCVGCDCLSSSTSGSIGLSSLPLPPVCSVVSSAQCFILSMAPPKSKMRHWAASSRRRPLLLRRAMLHSLLCFLVGLFTGLAPSDWTDAASRAAANANAAATKQVFRALHAVDRAFMNSSSSSSLSLLSLSHQHQHQLVVVVTTTGQSERERRSAGLTRTAHALRLVSPPVVWLVVEAARDAAETALLLRRTGVVYRHVTYEQENFNSSSSPEEEERHHQRSVAMAHIEEHRIRGVVLFAGLADVYDLRLLEQLRRIRTFGAWPVATVWENRVDVRGPVCSTSPGPGGGPAAWFWFGPDQDRIAAAAAAAPPPPPPAVVEDVHGFAFSSDLLLDPARWDRFPTSEPDQSQDSIKFVQRLLFQDQDQDYNKTRAIINCSEIMAWRVDTAMLHY